MKVPDITDAMDLAGQLGAQAASLEHALDALEEALGFDNGDDPEWIEWANALLPFMHRNGRLKSVVGFS